MVSLQHEETAKWTNVKATPRSKIPSPSASEKATRLVSFSSMVGHGRLNRTNIHATSVKYMGPTFKINVLLLSREKEEPEEILDIAG